MLGSRGTWITPAHSAATIGTRNFKLEQKSFDAFVPIFEGVSAREHESLFRNDCGGTEEVDGSISVTVRFQRGVQFEEW